METGIRYHIGHVWKILRRLGWSFSASHSCWRRPGLTVAEHQARTVANYLELHSLAPELPFVPVLQGWSLDDCHRCVELYEARRRQADTGSRWSASVRSADGRRRARSRTSSTLSPPWACDSTASASRCAAWPDTRATWRRPTRWPGASTLDGPIPCRAAVTRAARPACATPGRGASGCCGGSARCSCGWSRSRSAGTATGIQRSAGGAPDPPASTSTSSSSPVAAASTSRS